MILNFLYYNVLECYYEDRKLIITNVDGLWVKLKLKMLKAIFLLVILSLIFVLIGCSNDVYIPPDPIVEVKTYGDITKTKQKKLKIIVKNVTDSDLINVELWVGRNNISTKNKDLIKKVKNIKPGSTIKYYVDLNTEEDKNIQYYSIWIEGYYKKISPEAHFMASYNYPDLFQKNK